MNEPKPPELDNEEKLARKWLQKGTQSLIQWMPTGGSGWLLASFIREQEWVNALITFPVMIVTVVWAAYTESFLTQLREVYKEKGKEDVIKLKAWFDKTDQAIKQAIKWELAGTEEKYLRYQSNACLLYTTAGLNSTFKPLLKDIFVPLELSGNFLRGTDGDNLPMLPGFTWDKKVIELHQRGGLRIWDILIRAKQNPSYRSLAILAYGGYGKTTLLRHITYTYTQKNYQRGVPKLLPVLLYLRQWQKVISETNELDLPSLIEQHHIPNLPEGKELKLPPNWSKNLLSQGKMLIMFDGFDEVKEEWRDYVSRWIGKQMNDYPKTFFILTSRPGGYRSYTSEYKPAAQLFVKAFNEDQRERFVQRWYLSRERHISAEPDNPVVKQEAQQKTASFLQQLSERQELNNLAKNPLLLNMMVSLHSTYPTDKLPSRRSELYQEILRLQLGDRPLAKQMNLILPASESQQVLQRLALYMVQKNKPKIEPQLLLEQLQIHLSTIDESVDTSQFLQQIEQVSELLVKRDENYEFAHLSFQGYLAAVAIKENKQEELLLQHWQESWWKETILLYTAQVNPSNFIRALSNIGKKEAVNLAYDCLRETPRKVDSSLEEELKSLESGIQNLRYQQLEEYLEKGQWREADEETYRVMIQTVGKEEGQWLEPEDLEKFPCEDLRTINQLWLKYSKGHFGFSVQKEIWIGCGGKPGEYNYKVYKKFATKVGWYMDGEGWYMYDKSSFSLQEAKGHLPFSYLVESLGWYGGRGEGFFDWDGEVVSLLSRTDL